MAPISTAEIVAVGTELLDLDRQDTNSVFLTSRLAEIGVSVRAKAVVSDHRATLAAVLRAAMARAPLVIATGGLGPTDDDLTRDVAASVTGWPLRDDPELLATIETRFARRGVAMPAINRRQAQVPEGATVLPNPHGSAPGLLFELGDRLLVLLPGPPREMQPMYDDYIAPRLAGRAVGGLLRRRLVRVTDRSESQVEEIAFPIYSRPASAGLTVSTTILASPGQIELHLSAAGHDPAELDAVLAERVDELAQALAPAVFSIDGRSIEEVVGALLARHGRRIAVAESCTGGLLLGRLTDVSGSSSWVTGGVVAYDNAVKVEQLGVPEALIARDGAVSESVASAMAEGVRRALHADVGVGVTGIAGPTGGTLEKPVGTVAIAVVAEQTFVRSFRFPGEREIVRRFATSAALNMVRLALADWPAPQ